MASRGDSVRFWSSAFSAPVRTPGVTSCMAGGIACRSLATSSGEQTSPRNPALVATVGQAAHLIIHVRIEADFLQRPGVEARQHRHAQNERRAVAKPPRGFLRGLFGGLEHFQAAAGVHGEHLHVQLHRRGDGLGDGVGDVVKFQIQEHQRAPFANPAHDVRSGDW